MDDGLLLIKYSRIKNAIIFRQQQMMGVSLKHVLYFADDIVSLIKAKVYPSPLYSIDIKYFLENHIEMFNRRDLKLLIGVMHYDILPESYCHFFWEIICYFIAQLINLKEVFSF